MPAAVVAAEAPEFVRRVTALMMAGEGDSLPVSAVPADRTSPVGTTKWKKRNIAQEVPVWDESICIQCSKCLLVCPHAVIRGKVYDPAALADAPLTFKSTAAHRQGRKDEKYTLQVAPSGQLAVAPVKGAAGKKAEGRAAR